MAMRPRSVMIAFAAGVIAGAVAATASPVAAQPAEPTIQAPAVPAASPTGPAGGPGGAATPPPAPRIDDAALLDDFVSLAFDADPIAGTAARDHFSRWAGGMRIFVYGDAAAHTLVAEHARVLPSLTGLSVSMVTGGQPNLFVAVAEDPGPAFDGPLRPLLQIALGGDQQTVSEFIAAVVSLQPCWVLPVWSDPSRQAIKAAVIGINSTRPPAERARCIARGLASALGLLGPDLDMPRSVFDARGRTTQFSREDRLLLRLLFNPGLTPGLDRDATRAAAAELLHRLRGGARPRAPRPAPPG